MAFHMSTQHTHHTQLSVGSESPLRSLIRKVESGSSGGDDYGMTLHVPFLLAVLFIGLVFGMIGFWRVGASYATQNGTQTGGVAPGRANSTIGAFYTAWSNAQSVPSSNVNVFTGDRRTVGTMSTNKNFDLGLFGNWTLGLGAQTQSRSERFYPGAPQCADGDCNE